MINAHRTGAYISSLRKARDWTQLQLAENLHVTHQAVSQWEQGASLPDVSLLPPLARLFGITVDELLSGGPVAKTRRITPGAIVEELARGNPGEVARLVRDDPEGVNVMLETAPLASPSQLDAVASNLAGHAFTLEQIVQLAPFVSQDVLQALLDRTPRDPIAGAALVELAPFLPQATVARLAEESGASIRNLEQLGELGPFLPKQTLQAMLARILDSSEAIEPERLEELAPFLDEEMLEALIERLPAGPVATEHVVAFAPFVSQATLAGLIGRLEQPDELGDHLRELAPFLGNAGLKQAVEQLRRPLGAEELLDLAPFLDKETLAAILRAGPRG